jgi:hypothetical protein
VLTQTGRAALGLLSAGCLAIAALTPLEIRVIARGLAPAVPAHTLLGALKGPWVLQPVFADFSILAPTWLWIMLPALGLGVIALLLAASRGGALRVRRVPAWRSATGISRSRPGSARSASIILVFSRKVNMPTG